MAAALAMLWSGTALADRRAALHGNQLIEDSEDVFLNPALGLKYKKRLEVELGGDGSTGRALFLGGWDDLVLGFSAQQGALPGLFTGPVPGDLLARETSAQWLGTTGAPFGSVAFPGQNAPFSLLDGFLAMPVGDMNFGLRATVGMTGASTTSGSTDDGNSQTLIGLNAGLTGGQPGDTRWEASLNATMNFLDVAAGGAGDQSGTNLRVAGSARLFLPYNEWLDIGVLGNVGLFSGSVTTGTGATESTGGRMGFGVIGGAGPVYRLQDGSTLAVYGLVGLATSSVDPDTDVDDNSTSDLIAFFPAVRAAAEIAVTDWFYLRGGMQYSFQFASTSFDAGGVDSSAERGGTFGWSAGVGAKSGRFAVDGALQQAWLTQGPDFLGGDSALFGVVSITYSWDKAAEPVAAAPAAAPTAAPFAQ